MRRFIFLTKTLWQEPPRLRHQLARLLVGAGHEVVFFQKPCYPWQKEPLSPSTEEGIHFHRHQEFIHHKLRHTKLLYHANAAWVKKTISRTAKELRFNPDDVVVNFNYEYGFLRDIFPRNLLITIINDDFWSSALLGYEKPLKRALELTCKSSNFVLTVSKPLQKFLRSYCEPQLFLPWASYAYREPMINPKRDTLLFWGFINRKIDFQYVVDCADCLIKTNPEIRMLFVGPLEIDDQYVQMLHSKPNIEIKPASSLDELPIDRVFSGFIPYRNNVPDIDVIAFPNKAFQLLARGLPLLIKGMPDFLRAPFVFRMEDADSMRDIRQIQGRFEELQANIREYLFQNTAQDRLKQFMGFLS